MLRTEVDRDSGGEGKKNMRDEATACNCDFNTLDTWLNHLKRRLRLGSKNDQSINQKEENHLLAAGSGKEGRWLSPSMQHTQEAE